MTILYKLTDENDRTYGGCQWGAGIQHVRWGKGPLCGNGWTHWCTDPVLAVLLNPIHADFDLATAHLWEGEGTVGIDDNGLKVGCTDGRTLRRMEMPRVTLEQRIRFGILCARAVCEDPGWNLWAAEWLSGHDRTEAKARASAEAEAAEVWWASQAAVDAARATWGAWAAAKAAVVAARAAEAAAARTPWAVAARAAAAADWAAKAAASAKASRLDLIAIAREAVAALRATEAALMATGAAAAEWATEAALMATGAAAAEWAAEWAAEAAEASRLDLIAIAREAVE